MQRERLAVLWRERLESLADEDTGIGIAPDRLTSLFERFTQADTSTTRRFGGTGLGLSLSKQLAEMMGGELTAESEPGIGSTFVFTIRLERSEARFDDVTSSCKRLLCSRQALIVEGQQVCRVILRKQLEAIGMRVDVVSNAEQAAEKLSRASSGGEAYDLALIDVQTPEVRGGELAETIGGRPELGQPRVVRVGASDGLPIGQVQLLRPVRLGTLGQTLLRAFGSRQPIAEVSSLPLRPEVARLPRVGSHVLVAEDNAVNQVLVRRLLERFGHTVDIAKNGLQVLEKMAEGRYDLLLMDCQMPELDGLEATRRLRARGETLPIIALTASAMKGDRERCLEVGMNDCLRKPIDRFELDRVVQFWAYETRATGEVPEAGPRTTARGTRQRASYPS